MLAQLPCRKHLLKIIPIYWAFFLVIVILTTFNQCFIFLDASALEMRDLLNFHDLFERSGVEEYIMILKCTSD